MYDIHKTQMEADIKETPMPDLFKNLYNAESVRGIALDIASVYPGFQVDAFMKSTMDEGWEGLELKARMRRVSTNLGAHLPTDYREAIGILDQVAPNHSGLPGMVFPDFVEVFGQDEKNFDLSAGALERYTPYSSSEFAVRPFIIKYEARMMAQMTLWAGHENEHVRRLSSEGCRPRLPWAQALPGFQEDPSPILPILEQLKTDPSPYVRKSVANNLNDISKNHPGLVTKIAKGWYGKNGYADWIVKHGCRTLLKKGNRDVLDMFGYHDSASVTVENFALHSVAVSVGDEMTFSFSISAAERTKVRLEYGIDYVKANNKRNRKIFQISEVYLKKNEKKIYEKKHSFADVSIRKHYPGVHSITLIVNGSERGTLDFELT